MALPPEERGALAASLLESLEERGELDLNAEAAWQHEVARRMEEIDSAKVKPVPWIEVKRSSPSYRRSRSAFTRSDGWMTFALDV